MRRVPLAAVLLLFGTALTAPAFAETLQDALVGAYETNPGLAAQRAALRALDENVPQALSGWRPVVSLSGSAGKMLQDRSDIAARQNLTPVTADLSVTQPVFNAKTVPQTRSAEQQVEAGRFQLLSAEQQVLLQAVTAYMDVVRDSALVDLNRNNEQVLQRQLEATNDRFRVGEVTRTDVSQAESRLAKATADRVQAEGNLVASRATYQRIVGTPPNTLDPNPPLPAPPPDQQEALAMADRLNPDLEAARYLEKSSAHDIDVSLANLYPTLSVVGDLNHSDETTLRNFRTDSASLLARVVMPLYQSGAEYSQIRQRKETNSQRKLQISDTRQQVRQAVTQAWEGLQTAQARIVSNDQQVRSTQIALEGVQQEAQVGSRTTLDVLNAEQETLDAKTALVSSQRDAYVAAYTLQSTVGHLTADQLKLPVKVYDPNKHFSKVRNQWFGTSPSGE